MAGTFVIPKDAHELQRTYEVLYGPFAQASMIDTVLDFFTKNTVVDAVEVIGGTEAGGASSFKLLNVTSGQTVAQAITATQHITAAVDLTAATDGDVLTPAVDEDWNILNAGDRIAIDATGTATSLAGLLIKVRYSEIVSR